MLEPLFFLRWRGNHGHDFQNIHKKKKGREEKKKARASFKVEKEPCQHFSTQQTPTELHYLNKRRNMVFALRSAATIRHVVARNLLSQRSFTTTQCAASSHGLMRLKEYYDSTLSEDLMTLTYDHSRAAPSIYKYPDIQVQLDRALAAKEEEQKQQEEVKVQEGEEQPKEAVRTRKGGKPVKPIQPPKSASTIPGLDKITLHAMVKDAILSKHNLLSAFMAFQSITSTRPEVVYARTSVANWKLR